MLPIVYANSNPNILSDVIISQFWRYELPHEFDEIAAAVYCINSSIASGYTIGSKESQNSISHDTVNVTIESSNSFDSTAYNCILNKENFFRAIN
ncbi:hypothetical protein SAMN03159453_05639 [Pseudomonas sp. NFIX28]|nr:hypothetical protein SAMN03159453_05639 [Pseudomonas sp. NFIX28]